MPRPPSTALTIVAKLSSVRIMSAASFVTSVPVIPIATPMSARLSAGRVVDAVAGHRDDVALALEHRRRGAPCPPARRGRRRRSRRPARRAPRRSSPRTRCRCIARPSMPSWPRSPRRSSTWSPVIMRDADPGLLAAARSRPSPPCAAGRRCRRAPAASGPAPRRAASPPGSNAAGSKSRVADGQHAQALAGEPVVLGQHAARGRRRPGTRAPSASRIGDERASSTSGAPLTKQRTTLRPSRPPSRGTSP